MKIPDIKDLLLNWNWTLDKAVGAIFILVASITIMPFTTATELPVILRFFILMVFFSAIYYVAKTRLFSIFNLLARSYRFWFGVFSSINSLRDLTEGEMMLIHKIINSGGHYSESYGIKKIVSKGVVPLIHNEKSKIIKFHWLVALFVNRCFLKLREREKQNIVKDLSDDKKKYLSVFFNNNVSSLKNEHGLIPYQVTEYYDYLSGYNLIKKSDERSGAITYKMESDFSRQINSKHFKVNKYKSHIELSKSEVQAHIYTTGGGLTTGRVTNRGRHD